MKMPSILFLCALMQGFFLLSQSWQVDRFQGSQFVEQSRRYLAQRGFSLKPAGTNSNKSMSDKEKLESSIQSDIDSQDGLREAMQLDEDIRNLKLLKQSTSSPVYTNELQAKLNRLSQLEQEKGWTKETVHSRLLEITWDRSAGMRDDRQKKLENSITKDIEDFMLSLATLCTEPSGNILDVGCGTGILLDFVIKNNKRGFDYKRWFGVDLSKEMIKLASSRYPHAAFEVCDFLFYPTSDQTNNSFSTIVFNECLHYFLNTKQAIQHAKLLLNQTPGGQIIISHPRGYENVFRQYNMNRHIVGNLLPTTEELSTVADELGLKLSVKPDIRAKHYLATLTE